MAILQALDVAPQHRLADCPLQLLDIRHIRQHILDNLSSRQLHPATTQQNAYLSTIAARESLRQRSPEDASLDSTTQTNPQHRPHARRQIRPTRRHRNALIGHGASNGNKRARARNARPEATRDDVQTLPEARVAAPSRDQERVARHAAQGRQRGEVLIPPRPPDPDARGQGADGVPHDGGDQLAAGARVGAALRDLEVEGHGEHHGELGGALEHVDGVAGPDVALGQQGGREDGLLGVFGLVDDEGGAENEGDEGEGVHEGGGPAEAAAGKVEGEDEGDDGDDEEEGADEVDAAELGAGLCFDDRCAVRLSSGILKAIAHESDGDEH